MTTSLVFEAPADLSIGRVRLSNEVGQVKEWTSTPETRRFRSSTAKAGYYLAEITPTGVAPQLVVFEVKRGKDNKISLPDFSALSATGNNVSFFNVSDVEKAATTLLRPREGSKERANVKSKVVRSSRQVLKISQTTKRISVALSQECTRPSGSFRPFCGRYQTEVSGDRLIINVQAAEAESSWLRDRVRLSISIEDVGIERMFLPMYRGGTTISIVPSSLSPTDVEIEIMPSETRTRALVRVLSAGTSSEALELQRSILQVSDFQNLLSEELSDPWGATLAGLLMVRFPEVFKTNDLAWASEVCTMTGGTFDSLILLARATLISSGKGELNRSNAATEALDLLKRAQSKGSPYYAYTNQLFGEMIGGLCTLPDLDANLAKRALGILQRWQRDLPLQSSAGVAFSWYTRDPQIMERDKILAPNRRVAGILNSKFTTRIFQGQLGAGKIGFNTVRSAKQKDHLDESLSPSNPFDCGEVASSPSDFTQNLRLLGPPDDPNKGSFGGRSAAGGYVLTTSFEDNPDKRSVTANVRIESSGKVRPELGDIAWFCLHPTFSPRWIKVTFVGNVASLSLRIWGGFTVGAWLPAPQIELECDLAQLDHAPRIVKEL